MSGNAADALLTRHHRRIAAVLDRALARTRNAADVFARACARYRPGRDDILHRAALTDLGKQARVGGARNIQRYRMPVPVKGAGKVLRIRRANRNILRQNIIAVCIHSRKLIRCADFFNFRRPCRGR